MKAETAKRIELIKLLQANKIDDEKPGETISRALRGAPKQFDRQLAYRCDEEMHNRLHQRAKHRGTTVSDLIRQYIEWGLENDQL